MEKKVESKVEKKKVTKPKLTTVRVTKNICGDVKIFSVKYNPYKVTTEEKAFLKKHGAI